MNIPSKITKTSYLSQEKAQSYQKTANKYYKQHQRLKKEYELPNSNKSKSLKQKNFRDEVMKWFFSLDLMTKLIISSIENKWITCMIHQLYVNQINEPRMRYKVKEFDFFNFSNQNSANEYVPSLIKTTIIDSAYNSTNTLPQDYLSFHHYFSKEEGYYNNYLSYCQMSETEKNFLNEIKFYRSEEVLSEVLPKTSSSQNSNSNTYANINKYSNYFTLSEKILQDENLFKNYFNKLSHNMAFTSLIDSSYEQTAKCYNICLPNWITNRDYYSLSEIFAALFEQVISVRFVLSRQNHNECFNQKTQFESIYEENKELACFIKNNIAINEIFQKLTGDEIIDELHSHKVIEDFIIARFHIIDRNNYQSIILNKADKEFLLDKGRLNKIDLKNYFEAYFNKFKNGEEFMNNITFLPLDKIFSYDDFLFRKFYESLLNLRSQLNAMDLMKELEIEDEYADIKGERKKSETINNNQVAINSGNIASAGNKNNKKKKKKKKCSFNTGNIIIPGVKQNVEINHGNSNRGTKGKDNRIENKGKDNECNLVKMDQTHTPGINNNMIISSIDLDHIILEIKTETREEELQSNDLEKNIIIEEESIKSKGNFHNHKETNDICVDFDKVDGKREIINNDNNFSSNNSNEIMDAHNNPAMKPNKNTPSRKKSLLIHDANSDGKKYAFNFIKRRKKSNQEEELNYQNNLYSQYNHINTVHKEENDNVNQKITTLSPSSSTSICNLNYTEKEFMGSLMLIKQNSNCNNLNISENSVFIKDILDDIISGLFEIVRKSAEENKLNIIENIRQMKSIHEIKKSVSRRISEKADQNDIDTAYSSDGNKSESAENKNLNNFKGKNKKRKKENKFFLYNIKESNLTGYKNKNNFKSAENTNSKIANKNENRKLSQPSGDQDTKKILKQIIDHHYEKTKDSVIFHCEKQEEESFKENEVTVSSVISDYNESQKNRQSPLDIINKNKVFKNEENNLITHLNSITSAKSPEEKININDNQSFNSKSSTTSLNNIRISNYNSNPAPNSNPSPTNKNSNSPKVFHNLLKQNNLNTEFVNLNTSNSQMNDQNLKKDKESTTGKMMTESKYSGSDNTSSRNLLGYKSFNYNPSYNQFQEKPSKNKYYDSCMNMNMNLNMNINIPTINPLSSISNIFYPSISTFNSPFSYNSVIKSMKPFPFSPYGSNDYFLHNSNQLPHNFDIFYLKLQRDILEFSDSVDFNLKKLKPIKLSTISYLENVIKKFFNLNFEKFFDADVDIYGSFASDLGIESSDIDITIKLENKIIVNESSNDIEVDIMDIMVSLVENFKQLGTFETITPIYTASVPVIKLVIDPLAILDDMNKQKFEEFKQFEAYKNYAFKKDELDKIRIDLTFSEINNSRTQYQRLKMMNTNYIDNLQGQIIKNITQLHLDYIKECLIIYPELKPIVQILKRFLQINKLNCSFNGKNITSKIDI